MNEYLMVNTIWTENHKFLPKLIELIIPRVISTHGSMNTFKWSAGVHMTEFLRIIDLRKKFIVLVYGFTKYFDNTNWMSNHLVFYLANQGSFISE